MTRDLPKSVFEKSGRWYLVRAEGTRRVWIPLCRTTEGLPGLYLALAKETAPVLPELVPALIAEWQGEVMPRHAAKTQKDEIARCRVVADAFPDFTAAQMEPVGVGLFLKQWQHKPRTFNAYRELVRELMRFAEEKGYRPVGTNPTGPIKTMRLQPRKRYITDSELRRIKVAAMRGRDDKDTRSGPMLCALLDMAYLTGQAISDLLDLRWSRDSDEPNAPHIREGGIWFARKKLQKTTREEVEIGWTPRLRDVVRRLKLLRLSRPGASDWLFIQKAGEPYTYWGASSAWRRARARSGVKGCTFHDLRAKALTDKEAREGMKQARIMGSHSTEDQTADYVRNKTTRKTGATR